MEELQNENITLQAELDATTAQLSVGSAVANAFEAKVSDPARKPQGMNDGNTGSRFAALTNLRESEHVVPITGSGSKSTPNLDLAKESRPLFSGSASRFKVHGSMGRPQQERNNSRVSAPKDSGHNEVSAIPAYLNKTSEKNK
ncbi:hypothetical protein COLO4_04190 [Corchorus olitorius]|uniref:Uncharacterized protein n=1 Tax=Corchorus olitorius TaxID=93759 RepID=A0A1R3KUX9_9ROSI|nr:hypothetical protein COLO4_04190 [Corchorus olitorius]